MTEKRPLGKKNHYRSAGRHGKHSPQRRTSAKGTASYEGRLPTEIQLPLDQNDLVEMMQDSLHSFAVEVGLVLASTLQASRRAIADK